MAYGEISGTLYKITPTINVSKTEDRPFFKRHIILEEKTEKKGKPFSELIKMTATGSQAEAIDDFSEGDKVIAKYYISGRTWTSKEKEEVYFTELNAYSISHQDIQMARPSKYGNTFEGAGTQPGILPDKVAAGNDNPFEESDLPF